MSQNEMSCEILHAMYVMLEMHVMRAIYVAYVM